MPYSERATASPGYVPPGSGLFVPTYSGSERSRSSLQPQYRAASEFNRFRCGRHRRLDAAADTDRRLATCSRRRNDCQRDRRHAHRRYRRMTSRRRPTLTLAFSTQGGNSSVIDRETPADQPNTRTLCVLTHRPRWARQSKVEIGKLPGRRQPRRKRCSYRSHSASVIVLQLTL